MPSINAFNAAVSGLNAASTRLRASAANVANVTNDGRIGATDPEDQAFQAREVQQSTQPDGGTQARIVSREPGTQVAFDPDSSQANSEGFVEVPDVDLAEEAANQIQAEAAFKASATLIRTLDETQDTLLDIKS